MAVNLLIAFYSRDGSTEKLANAVAEGARGQGAEVRLRRARELVGADTMAKAPGWSEKAAAMNSRYEAPTEADAEWADAIAFGSPTRFGNVSSELKAFVDGLGGLWFQGKLVGKAGGAFCATATTHGGAEFTLLSTYNFMAHLGLIIVPNGYGDPIMFRAGTPYGAHAAVDGQHVKDVSEDDLAVARHQGSRLTKVAAALKAAHQTETK